MTTKKPLKVIEPAEQLSPEILHLLRSTQSRVAVAKVAYDSLFDEIVAMYKLEQGDNLDISTGVIKRKPKEK